MQQLPNSDPKLQAFAKSITKIRKEGVVFVSSVNYMVYPKLKVMICGEPAPEHQKLKELMTEYGWTVISHALGDTKPDDTNPDEMSFAESIVNRLLDC